MSEIRMRRVAFSTNVKICPIGQLWEYWKLDRERRYFANIWTKVEVCFRSNNWRYWIGWYKSEIRIRRVAWINVNYLKNWNNTNIKNNETKKKKTRKVDTVLLTQDRAFSIVTIYSPLHSRAPCRGSRLLECSNARMLAAVWETRVSARRNSWIHTALYQVTWPASVKFQFHRMKYAN